MNKIIILILILQAGSLKTFSQNWDKISNKIASCQKQALLKQNDESNKIFKYFIKEYDEVRRESRVFERLNIQKCDTIYILEKTDQVSLSLLSTIWTRSSMLSYSSSYAGRNKYKVELMKERYFSKRMMDLAFQWNIQEIRKEEKANQTLPVEIIFLTRIIISGKKPQIDCMIFCDFWNLNHD